MNHAEAKVAVKTAEVGLTYQWYFKNAGASTYSKSSITTNTYSMTMDAVRNGRQVYCVITDKFGNSVQSDIAILRLPVSLTITKQPQSNERRATLLSTSSS